MHRFAVAGVAGALFVLSAGQALADVGDGVPELSFSGRATGYNPYGTDAQYVYTGGTYIQQDGDYSTGNVFVGETIMNSSPAPSAYAKAYARGNYSGFTQAVTTWYVQGTLGLDGTVASNMPVLLNGDAFLEYNANTGDYAGSPGGWSETYAWSMATVKTSGTPDQNLYCGGVLYPGFPQNCGDNAVSDDFNLQSTDKAGIFQGWVSIITSATVIDDTGAMYGRPEIDPSTKYADAYIDPVITIDPAFLLTHPGATLTFSAGVQNGQYPTGVIPPTGPTGVPEPATWAMMLLGVGFAGGALRSNRASRSATA